MVDIPTGEVCDRELTPEEQGKDPAANMATILAHCLLLIDDEVRFLRYFTRRSATIFAMVSLAPGTGLRPLMPNADASANATSFGSAGVRRSASDMARAYRLLENKARTRIGSLRSMVDRAQNIQLFVKKIVANR
jgi:hypothetical protein